MKQDQSTVNIILNGKLVFDALGLDALGLDALGIEAIGSVEELQFLKLCALPGMRGPLGRVVFHGFGLFQGKPSRTVCLTGA